MQLKEQLVDIANSTLNGKYIFNGEQYSTKPYDFAKGADGTYDVSKPVTTDPGQIQFIVGEGVRMPISMTGNDVFGNTGDSDNLYTIINSISAGLKAGDLGAISGQLDNIDTRMETILTARSEIGAKTNRVELMQERLSDLNVNLTDLQAKTEDADYEGLIMQSKIQENIYNASLSVGAKIISTTLVDFIR
ncbi:Flagellar hook-associated protein 3 [compost metagenome]